MARSMYLCSFGFALQMASELTITFHTNTAHTFVVGHVANLENFCSKILLFYLLLLLLVYLKWAAFILYFFCSCYYHHFCKGFH